MANTHTHTGVRHLTAVREYFKACARGYRWLFGRFDCYYIFASSRCVVTLTLFLFLVCETRPRPPDTTPVHSSGGGLGKMSPLLPGRLVWSHICVYLFHLSDNHHPNDDDGDDDGYMNRIPATCHKSSSLAGGVTYLLGLLVASGGWLPRWS